MEGKTGLANEFATTKRMMDNDPSLLKEVLSLLADNLADYACYQIDSGAQVIQVFDSWAGQLSPQDYETFALPYQQQVVRQVKETHPDILDQCVTK